MKKRFLRVTMPDNSVWKVNVNEIAENKAEYYSEFKGANYEEILKDTLEDNEELIDWAENNMEWSTVQSKAMKIRDGQVDYEDGWHNGPKTIISED